MSISMLASISWQADMKKTLGIAIGSHIHHLGIYGLVMMLCPRALFKTKQHRQKNIDNHRGLFQLSLLFVVLMFIGF